MRLHEYCILSFYIGNDTNNIIYLYEAGKKNDVLIWYNIYILYCKKELLERTYGYYMYTH